MKFSCEVLLRVLKLFFYRSCSWQLFSRLWDQRVWCLRHGRGNPMSWSYRINLHWHHTSFTYSLRTSSKICFDLHSVAMSWSIITSCSVVSSAKRCNFLMPELRRWPFRSGEQICAWKISNQSSWMGSLELSHLFKTNALSCGANNFIVENISAFKFCRVFQAGSPKFIWWHLGNTCPRRWQLVGLTGAALPRTESTDDMITIQL